MAERRNRGARAVEGFRGGVVPPADVAGQFPNPVSISKKLVTKPSLAATLLLVTAALVIAGLVFSRDLLLSRGRTHDCGDGPRTDIDLRQFATRYSQYSLVLEGEVRQGKGSLRLEPRQLQTLSEALQKGS